MDSTNKWLTPTQFLRLGAGAFSRNWLYNQLATGQLRHVRIGAGERQKILIPSNVLSQMVKGGVVRPDPPDEARND